ncbi:MAG: TolC family protein [Prolixibacteraceae bacterium]
MKNLFLAMLLMLPGTFASAQEPVTLDSCRSWAREAHPFLKQKELYGTINRLKLENNRVANLPRLILNAQATYQSDVTKVNIQMPGVDIPEQAKDQYKAYLDARQNIWDGGLVRAGEILEEAKNQANQQGVEVELYKVQEQVNDLFFNSFILQENLNILERKQETLESRKTRMESGVRNGMILQSDLDLILAELIKIRQQQIELASNRETTLAALAILTGKEIADLQNLAINTTAVDFHAELQRPELDYFQLQNQSLAASSDLIKRTRNPQVFGFGQAGYGRPGLNMLDTEFNPYYLVGIGLNWKIFDWKANQREQEVVRLQQQMVQTQQQQFERNIQIALDRESKRIQQLSKILESDRELIVLQEQITKSSASKHENGTITTSDYIQDLNAEMAARITFETHKVQLEAAKINYQNIQGK